MKLRPARLPLAVATTLLVLQPGIANAPAQVPPGGGEIKVVELNAKSGHPIVGDTIQVWFTTGDPKAGPVASFNLRTDGQGAVVVPVSPASLAAGGVQLKSSYYRDCRPFAPGGVAMIGLIRYPVEEIITRGLVTANTCGGARAAARPGVAVLFARPFSLWEKLWE